MPATSFFPAQQRPHTPFVQSTSRSCTKPHPLSPSFAPRASQTGQNAGDPASRKDIAVLEARLVAVEAKMSEISTAATAGAVVQKVGKGHGIN